jgi:hypothetical protein
LQPRSGDVLRRHGQLEPLGMLYPKQIAVFDPLEFQGRGRLCLRITSAAVAGRLKQDQDERD